MVVVVVVVSSNTRVQYPKSDLIVDGPPANGIPTVARIARCRPVFIIGSTGDRHELDKESERRSETTRLRVLAIQ